jgi:replicative DNA helicase
MISISATCPHYKEVKVFPANKKPLKIGRLFLYHLVDVYFGIYRKINKEKGISTGIQDLDKIISCWQNSELIVIGSRPAVGKTSFIVSVINNIAVDSDIPVALFTLESSSCSFINKLIINISEVDSQKVRTENLDTQEIKIIKEAVEKLKRANIYIDDSKLSIQDLCDKARRLVLGNNVKIIFIDYIQLLTVTDKYTENRYNELNFISRELKFLAKELNIPIVVASQLNRNLEKGGNSVDRLKPRLTDLRDSGTICDDADMVCFIHRPEYYGICEDEQGDSLVGVAYIHIAKSRNGVYNSEIPLKFTKEHLKFQNNEHK